MHKATAVSVFPQHIDIINYRRRENISGTLLGDYKNYHVVQNFLQHGGIFDQYRAPQL